MNIANKLTLLRVLLVFVFMGVMWSGLFDPTTTLWLGLVIFVVASLTDFFDGYFARKYNLVTNLGKFIDPLADKMLVAAAMIAIVDIGSPVGYLPGWVVVMILLREFAVSGIRLAAASQNIVVAANKLGKIKTVCQMAMIIVFLIPIASPLLSGVAFILVYASLILTIVSGLQYIMQNKHVLTESN